MASLCTERRSTSSHHHSIPPAASGDPDQPPPGLFPPVPRPVQAFLSSPPPPSLAHFPDSHPFCLVTAHKRAVTVPDTETSWISHLQLPLFLFTENPERASCTRDPTFPAAPALCLPETGLAPSWHAPTLPWWPPCLTLKGTHTFTSPSQGSSLQILDTTLSRSLHLPKTPHHCALQRPAHLPHGSQSGLSP